jgi:phosphoketolase
MTVSRTGVASQFESVDNQITLSNKDKNHLRRHFRGKRFRPVIVEGEPQTVEYIVNFTLPPNEITDSKESDAEDTPT